MEVDKDYNRPFFGKTKKLLERINSLDEKWYVEFWEVHYYLFGIDVYYSKKEVVKQNRQNGKENKSKI
ncbi:MAG: hypothetical protein CVT98_02575 [Bacteroidetes bacterium HGW-Bacteroidetes-15]|nr:MAG: hypothetical protein CVT98_02575 [Bacteroidetes bacterium HGW-Bacteroidetes-15]